MKPFAFYDLDGTLFKTSMLEAVNETATQSGYISNEYTERIDKARTEWQFDTNNEDSYTNFVGLSVEALIAAMRGQPTELLDSIVAETFSSTRIRRRRFVRESMQILGETRQNVIVSASLKQITQAVLRFEEIDIDPANIYGSEWEVEDGKFTGYGKTIDKKRVVKSLLDQTPTVGGSFAFGDTISDLDMLRSVDYGIMVNPSTTLELKGSGLHLVTESKDNIRYFPPDRSYSFGQNTTDILSRVTKQ